jgi:signal transduction histidine kinase
MNGARIMVVEDERIVAMHLRQQLIKLGYDVPAPLASGDVALQQVEQMQPDLILMDIHIDGQVDGIETAARLPRKYHIPVIYLTAYSEPATLERARATKPYGYLIKPFSERELHATIQMALERTRAEQMERHSEATLRQAQKMEAVGQLAGGVAHDFNNLLGVIIGNLDGLSEYGLADAEPAMMVKDALGAALRGASLTRHLLAFSRRQTLEPRVLRLDLVIGELVGLLTRTLGESIQIRTRLPADLWLARIDPNQLENAVINLAVNARDAMPEGGILTIEAENVVLDDDPDAAAVPTGRQVMISVTDTGTGMPKEVSDRVFEPFFTTKPEGTGTGLGLSMVFGFVQQSGGHIKIESAPGSGTAVRLYFPAAVSDAPDAFETHDAEPLPRAGSGEVILVVEDDPALRKITALQLAGLGYTAIAAEDGVEAYRKLQEEPRIDLLLTDIVLPKGMSGPTLAGECRKHRPGLKILYMSGYTKSNLTHAGTLAEGAHLLTKPFRKTDLAKKLRLLLDQTQGT